MDRRKALRKSGMMVGGSMMIPSFLFLLSGCKKEPRLGWEPLFLNEDEARFISTLVDTILPRTDTPGALDVKVDIFLDRVFAKTYDEAAQQRIRSDIQNFNADCKSQVGDEFANLTEADRIKVLKSAEAAGGKFNGRVWGTAAGKQEPVGFYRSIKSMALWAYLSSEEVGKNVLNYDPIPAVYQGCIPLAEVGNSWSF